MLKSNRCSFYVPGKKSECGSYARHYSFFQFHIVVFHPDLLLASAKGTVVVKACADDFTDARDGAQYKVVCIGTQTWMAENLRFAAGDSRCYNDNPANCVIYGRLYTWTTALNGSAPSTSNPSNVRGVCAAGWHMPSMALAMSSL